MKLKLRVRVCWTWASAAPLVVEGAFSELYAR